MSYNSIYPAEARVSGMCNHCCKCYEGTEGGYPKWMEEHRKETGHRSFEHSKRVILPGEYRIRCECNVCGAVHSGFSPDWPAFKAAHNHENYGQPQCWRQDTKPGTSGGRPVKAQPAGTKCMCSKCQGTGFWCKGVENGRPVSNTGFTCYSCQGKGWK